MIERLGRLLRPLRAGESHLAWNLLAGPEVITLSSVSFPAGGSMPVRCAGKGVGDNTSPALSWTGVPAQAVELVLIMEDPSAPLPRPFVHMVVTGIPPDRAGFAEGELAAGNLGIAFGRSSIGSKGYEGPRPVPGHGPHSYVFQLFALDRPLGLSEPRRKAVLAAAQRAVVGRARLDGLYER